MLDWIFKKNKAPATDRADRVGTAPTALPAQPAVTAAPAVDWQARLQAALGDDTALLAVARERAPVDVKVAAIGALASEAALKLAEREHRDRDRRVHQLAKQRHLAQVALRETAEQAGKLIGAATALVSEAVIPSNRLVELDRAWHALKPELLVPTQRAEFENLLARLAALTRERGDEALKTERWNAAARDALAGLRSACTAAAEGTQDRGQLAAAVVSARAVLDTGPVVDDTAALRSSLHAALQTSAELDERLAVLDELLQPAPAAPVAPVEAPTDETFAAAPTAPLDPASRWLQLAPLGDAPLAAALTLRHARWQQARDDERQARRSERRERTLDRERGVRTERGEALTTALERAEAALAAGHLADTHQQLVAIDELLHAGAPATPQRTRIDAVQAEYTRLKGWQHWGGGLAREELVLQAEALAAAALGESAVGIVKLSIKQHAEVIDDLRARWKELDRLGGASSRALWQRFDAALKAAYGPVAAHIDVQRAARQQNLQARDELVAALNEVPLPDLDEGAEAPDWKRVAAALEQFQSGWRKLGPLEHTVPHQQRDKLVARMGAAVQRLETPLNDARRGAEQARERLVARAQALAAEASAGAQGRELVGKVRDLQAEWQQHAASMPLARAVENALWSRFKTAIDAVFNARDAVFSARDAEFKAHGAERAALIERLAVVADDAPAAELKRALAEADAQWQRAGPAPRSDAAALDAQFRSARDRVARLLATSAQRRWHATCDALLAKLALCESLEQAADAAAARVTLASQWPAQAALPASWESALARRASLSAAAAPPGSPRFNGSVDELLLQLEAALQLASPDAFGEARRALKLQAMKAALEGRQSAAQAPLSADQLFADAIGRSALDAPQRERLGQVIAALRERGPPGAA